MASLYIRKIFVPSPIVFFNLNSDFGFSGLLNRTIDSDVNVFHHTLVMLAIVHDEQKNNLPTKFFAKNKSVESTNHETSLPDAVFVTIL